MATFLTALKTRTDESGVTLTRCQRPGCREYKPKQLQCSRCKEIQYCSKDCQAIHWKAAHKDTCIPEKNNDLEDKETAGAMNDKTCGLCFGRMVFEERAPIECKHDFHVSCFERMKSSNKVTKCPFCNPLPHNTYQSALASIAGRDLKTAELTYRKHIQENPTDTCALFGLASVLLIAGDKRGLNEVEGLMKKVMDVDKNDAKAMQQLAYFKNTSGHFDTAIQYYTQSLKVEQAKKRKTSMQTYIGLSRALFCKGEYASALDTMQQCCLLYPSSEHALRYLYVMLKVNGKNKEARKLLSKLQAKFCAPFDNDIWSMSLTLYKTEAPKHLPKLYKLLLAIPPKTNLVGVQALLTNLGMFFGQDPLKHDTAEEMLRLAVENNRRDVRALKALFSILSKKTKESKGKDAGLLEDTVQVGKMLAENSPKDLKGKVNLAILMQQQVDFDNSLSDGQKTEVLGESEALYREVLEADEENQLGLQYYGLFLQAQQRPAEAETCFEKLVALNDSHPTAKNYLKLVRMEQGKPAE